VPAKENFPLLTVAIFQSSEGTNGNGKALFRASFAMKAKEGKM
jgi:hypothetical protein